MESCRITGSAITRYKTCRMAVQDGGLPIETLCMGCADEKCDFKPMPMLRRPVGDEVL